ncbi:MAG: hypothetical protein AAGE05_08945 [Pseudomonadota bacterium]
MIIHAYPARSNIAANPYNHLLSDGLEALGWQVREPAVGQAFAEPADIVHIHWPQAALNQPAAIAIRRAARLFATLSAQRRRGAKIVWTAHNIDSHDSRRPRLERLFMQQIAGLLDGLIVLSDASRDRAIKVYPQLARLPWKTVPHAIYGDAYPKARTRDAARTHFGVTGERPVVGIVGDLKPYKGLDIVLRALEDMRPRTVTALVAGRFPDADCRDAAMRQIDGARTAGHDVALHEGRLDNQEMVDALATCDALLLPYRNAMNSGLAILAIERETPVLMAANPALRELEREVGSPLVKTSARFDAPTIADFAAHAHEQRSALDSAAFRAERAIAASAALTDRFFRSLIPDSPFGLRDTDTPTPIDRAVEKTAA